MVDLVILEIISLISFLYSIVLMFTSIVPINELILNFIFTVLVSVVFALNYKKSILYEIVYFLVFCPLLYYTNRAAIFFFIFVGVFTYIYIKKSLFKGSHHTYVKKLKMTYIFYAFLILLRTPFYDLSSYIDDCLVFIIIYLVSSIMLVRLHRHLDTKIDVKKIRRTNIRYLMIMTIILSLLVFDGVRTYFANGVDSLIKIIYYPMYLLARDIDLSGDWGLEENSFFSEDNPVESVPDGMGYSGEAVFSYREKLVVLFNIFIRLIVFIAVIVAIYMLYKLLMKVGEKKNNNADVAYVEEREFIRGVKKKKQKIRDIYPREPEEQVRYYYRKYLKRVNDVNEIQSTDTSLDVNNKAVGFDKDIIDKIRNIYISIRYGNKEAKEEVVREIESLYKKL